MGWYFSNQTRDQLIRELIQPSDTERAHTEVLAHTRVRDVLWSVIRVTAKQTGCGNVAPGESCCYIRCDLLERSGDQWGHKPMDESMHPYYYSCPLNYLDMAPVQNPEWRAHVHAYHAELTAGHSSAKAVDGLGLP